MSTGDHDDAADPPSAAGALLADVVHARLLDRIVDGTLPPGSALSVPALAAGLGVSRSPVRESVQRLIGDGLAVHVPHAGARVAHVDDAEILDVLRVRELLDGLAAHDATLRAGPGDLAALAAVLDREEEALTAAPDPRRDAGLDVEFHGLLRDLAGNEALRETLRRLEVKGHVHRSGMWSVPRHRELALAEHRRVLAAVEAGDAQGARAAAAAHVAALAVRLRRAGSTPPG